MITRYAYRGIDRRGNARIGRIETPPAQWVERCFDAGWQQLIVAHLDADFAKGDRSVGEIVAGATARPRTWWAEA